MIWISPYLKLKRNGFPERTSFQPGPDPDEPATSKISDVMYSRTQAMNTDAVLPILFAYILYLRYLWTRAGGNLIPALLDAETTYFLFFISYLAETFIGFEFFGFGAIFTLI